MADSGLASLIVAASDLRVVQLLTSGMTAVNAGRGGVVGPLGNITGGQIRPRPQVHPTPHFNPRPVVDPTPRFEPRPVMHVQPRLVEKPVPTAAPIEPEKPCRLKSPLDPPWKIHPCEIPPQPAPKVKLHILRPDIIHKGSLIDFYM